MSTPVKIRRFFWGDLAFPAVFVLNLSLAVGAHMTEQDPPLPLVAWVILWLSVVGVLLINILFFLNRLRVGKDLKYQTRGMTVGWTDDKWSVKPEDFEASVDAYLEKLRPKYPDLEKALAGCIVVFREPKWPIDVKKGAVAQYVAGLQDYNVLYVGWRENLEWSALWHEMTHRVFQVFEGDPPQEVAHKMMMDLGII